MTSYFTIGYSKSGTIIISFIFVITSSFIFGKSDKLSKTVIKLMIVAIMLLILFIIVDPFMDAAISIAKELSGEKVALRISVIKNLLKGRLSSGDRGILSRIDMIKIDMQTWLCSNPIAFLFGGGYHTEHGKNVIKTALMNGDGGHSGIFDIVARYGGIGVILLYVVLKQTWNYLYKYIGVYKKNVCIIIYFILIFNNIFNSTFAPGPIFIIFFVMPFCCDSGRRITKTYKH